MHLIPPTIDPKTPSDGQIDFVVVARGLGVLVLGVKACHRLRRERGG